ncbi:hypothetical protein [Niameybacter massiliensis]|uniref:hypothetical protein n=1 Tax=Niameybacter massiliensis TaxID=1658108 RepID=UPI0006B582D6|nr:hypothetical protein [Niameybacter massiliensis]
MEVKQEYERIKALFTGIDEKQLELIDGTIWEAARLRVELDDLYEIVKKSGLVAVSTKNPSMQKELPVSKMIIKVRANYLNYIAKLSNILGKNIEDDDNDLSDYED